MEKITDGKEMAEIFSNFATSLSPEEKEFVEGVTTEHRTLQQNMFRLMYACIKQWSEAGTFHDLRNEQTVKACKKIVALLEDEDYPFYLQRV